MSANCC